MIFTDGSCKRNEHSRLRRAGYGAFWGDAHPMNMSGPVPGKHQTNQRAELLAAVKACETQSPAADSQRLAIRREKVPTRGTHGATWAGEALMPICGSALACVSHGALEGSVLSR